jgi:hypothetical protein
LYLAKISFVFIVALFAIFLFSQERKSVEKISKWLQDRIVRTKTPSIPEPYLRAANAAIQKEIFYSEYARIR